MPLIAYVWNQDMGANHEGDPIQLDEDKAKPLLDAGLLREQTEDDVQGGDEDGVDEPDPAMANSLKKLIADGIVSGTKAALATMPKNAVVDSALPAQVIRPIFANQGEQIRALYFAKKRGNRNALEKLEQHNTQCWQAAEAKGMGVHDYEPQLRKKGSPAGFGESGDGQYAVNAEFSDEIFKAPHNVVALQDFCKKREARSNLIHMRSVSETSLATPYGGISIVQANEADTLSTTKPTLQNVDLQLQKYYGVVAFTNEELEDTSYPLLEDVNEMFMKAFVFKINNDLVTGSGNTEGVINSPSAISIAKESGQASSSLVLMNMAKMYVHMLLDYQQDCVYWVNPIVLQSLITMPFVVGGSSPAWGLTYNPQERIKLSFQGIPIVPTYAMGQLGGGNDIALVARDTIDFYYTNLRMDQSDAPYWLSDQFAIRYVFRCAFKSKFRSSMTGANDASTYSNIVTLASRGTT